jgi:propanediol dehydratase small subunit
MAEATTRPAEVVTARSGRPATEITVEALAAGDLRTADIMISADVLRAQAAQARDHGYGPFADNLERAAEMTDLPDDEILTIYEALRPFRSTGVELDAIAARLEVAGAVRCAALVREAADAYAARGVLRDASAAFPPAGRA